ncbi:MAG: DNA primase [Defluviitaleaceae bacterium]|nr:DNA primase [Defluviitaleaceae bacterium]MCL2835647.1 DNA primase [Defluviitaleaceae bacterium]
MAFFSDEVLDDVRRGNDIIDVISSYVRLKQRGGRYLGLCPFHREKTPSFSVSPDMQMFHCFGCNAGGNVVGFIMRVENLSFVDAVKHLADRARIELPEERGGAGKAMGKLRDAIYEANAKAARFYFDCLKQTEGEHARAYLLQRRIKNSMAAKFGLGYSPPGWDRLYKYLREQGFDDEVLEKGGLASKGRNGYGDRFRNMLMFPIIDAQGRVCGFGGRSFTDGGPKYLNSPETPVFSKNRNLFALNFARKTKSDVVIIVEGYMDTLALFQAGFEGVAATLGTAMGREHARALNQYFRGKTAVLLFDSDAAGEAAVLRAIPILRRENTKIKVLRLEGAKDPDEFLIKYGAEAFAEVLGNAMLPTDFQFALVRGKVSEDDYGRVAYASAAAQVLAELSDPIERDVYINAVAKETGVTVEAIRGRVEAAEGKQSLDFNVFKTVPTPRTKTDLPEALMAAYRNVLYWMSTHINLYEAIRDNLDPEEILFPVYKTLYGLIRAKRDAKGTVTPSELAGHFEEPSEQDIVSVIFAGVIEYENEDALKSNLNERIKRIKSEYIQKRIKDAMDNSEYEKLETLKLRQKELPASYI